MQFHVLWAWILNLFALRFQDFQWWQVFYVVITGALDELKAVLGDAVTLVMETIDVHIQCLFVQVLQLDPMALRLEAS
jgi:hypothetical protein